jgi:hypothetical protein
MCFVISVSTIVLFSQKVARCPSRLRSDSNVVPDSSQTEAFIVRRRGTPIRLQSRQRRSRLALRRDWSRGSLQRARRSGIRSCERYSHAKGRIAPWCTRARDNDVSGRSRVRGRGTTMVSRQRLRRSSVAIDPGIAFVQKGIDRIGEDAAARV